MVYTCWNGTNFSNELAFSSLSLQGSCFGWILSDSKCVSLNASVFLQQVWATYLLILWHCWAGSLLSYLSMWWSASIYIWQWRSHQRNMSPILSFLQMLRLVWRSPWMQQRVLPSTVTKKSNMPSLRAGDWMLKFMISWSVIFSVSIASLGYDGLVKGGALFLQKRNHWSGRCFPVVINRNLLACFQVL